MEARDRTLGRVAVAAWLLGALGTAAALVFASRWTALSVAAGAAVAIANFEALRRLGRRLFVPGRGRGAVAIVLGLKVVLLFGALYLLVVHVRLDGVALAGGASALVAAIVIEGVRSSLAPVETESS